MPREIALPHRLAAVVLAVGLGAWGCGNSPGGAGARAPRSRPRPLALSVRATADTGALGRLEIRPPRPARAWMARVTPAGAGAVTASRRGAPAPGGEGTPAPPLPDAAPDTLIPESVAPPALEVDPGLVPPILRGPAPLVVPPAGRRARRLESVELDVRVSETGEVTDVLAAGGTADPALVAAASACARRMRFYPALRGGEPVAVWCRQRFDFGSDGAPRP